MSNWVSAQVPAPIEWDVLAFLCDVLLVPLIFPTVVEQKCQYIDAREQALWKEKGNFLLACFG